MRISFISKGNALVTMPDTVFEGTFEELSKEFESYRPNKGKHDGYFVRGELLGKRSNANLEKADLLIIDGDQTFQNADHCISPFPLHEHLKKRKLNHFLYTSHSYDPRIDKYKWRCVIECPMSELGQLKPTLTELFYDLHENGLEIVNVKENWTWSQPWFLPNRAEDDGHYIFLSYFDGKPLKACNSTDKDDFHPVVTEWCESYGVEAPKGTQRSNLEAIRKGDSFYREMQALIWGKVLDGITRQAILDDMTFAMECSKAANPDHVKHEDWLERMEKLEFWVDEAIGKNKSDDEEVDLSELLEKEVIIPKMDDIPWPPGLFGQMCQEIYEMAAHPNKVFSMTSAFGLICGIAGRKYQVLNIGLNQYFIMLADTGSGKSIVKDTIYATLSKPFGGGDVPIGRTFLGQSRFTGPKAVITMLASGLSRVCVIEEAGLVGKSGAGDGEGLARVLLDLYTSSGLGKYSGAEAYSAEVMESLPSPALSVIQVSTPKSFIETLTSRDSVRSGELARCLTMRTFEDKPYLSTDRRHEFSEEVIERIANIMAECFTCQSKDNPYSPTELTYDVKKASGESNKWTDIYNQHMKDGKDQKATIASRAFVKIMKIAGIITVFNGETHIDDECFEWAKSLVVCEMEGIEHYLSSGAESPLRSLAQIVGAAIVKVMNNAYKDKQKSVSTEMRKAGVISVGVLNQILKNNATLRELDDPNTHNRPRTGIQKVIAYMAEASILHKIKEEDNKKWVSGKGKKAILYQISENEFKMLMGDEE